MAAKLIIHPPNQQGRALLAAGGMQDAEDIGLSGPDFVERRGSAPRRGNRFSDVLPRSGGDVSWGLWRERGGSTGESCPDAPGNAAPALRPAAPGGG
ncbi:hypothetical protein EES41_35365 [Streptomyces sp. ADI95-16]|nr:hypothetical protein EES41_35365 [Streptomyces sp. ADI95-16]